MQPLPKEFEEQMKRLLGEAGFFAYLDALNQPYTRALRINLLLRPDGTPPCPIEGLGTPVPWAKGAYFVEGDARPGLSPLHEGGLFYMQEPSALTAVTALDPQPGERVLDLCAAPGGKSTQIAALMAGRGLLCCNEPIPSRAQILSRNIERMGVRNAVVLSAMPDALAPRFPAFFDRILVDAPCSGEGMFRRQPEARDEWDADAPRRCADRQMEILAQAAKMLRPGGTMVYSTCTFNDTENEGVLKRFLALHPEFSLVPFALPGLPEAKDGYLHLYPHEMRGEGHFVSRLKKADGADKADAPVQAAPQRKAPARAAAKGKAPAPIALPDVFSDAFAPERLYTAGDALWMLPEGISIERLSGSARAAHGAFARACGGETQRAGSCAGHGAAPGGSRANRKPDADAGAGLSGGRNAVARRLARRLHPALLRGRFARLGQAGGRPDEKPLSQGSAAKVRAGFTSAKFQIFSFTAIQNGAAAICRDPFSDDI